MEMSVIGCLKLLYCYFIGNLLQQIDPQKSVFHSKSGTQTKTKPRISTAEFTQTELQKV